MNNSQRKFMAIVVAITTIAVIAYLKSGAFYGDYF